MTESSFPPVSPFVMVIFGATGDLTARKLMPALYHLFEARILPDKFFIVGTGRRELDVDRFRFILHEAVKKYSRTGIREDVWGKLSDKIFYHEGMFEKEDTYSVLSGKLKSFDREIGACMTRFFYLATPPNYYPDILYHLDSSKLADGCGQGSSRWTRILIEKPFGKDLETSRHLEELLSSIFRERQIYRIDHYHAKETVRNLFSFRFANTLFKSVWDAQHIDNIQLTLAESGGIGTRGKFYEGVGALRDTAQNHLMAMLAYTAMEEPYSFTADDIRAERARVLSAVRRLTAEEVRENVVRGQYGGNRKSASAVLPYREEKDVSPDSCTETFVAMKLFVDTPRWADMPFYLRTGKRLAKDAVSIDIQFKNPHSRLFSEFKFHKEAHANTLSINIQPREGITFRFFAKEPGLSLNLAPVDMEFSYKASFGEKITDAYEKILLDCMHGDQTLFATGEGYKATWEIMTGILKGWEKNPCPGLPIYTPGSWGPEDADRLIQKDGRHWLLH